MVVEVLLDVDDVVAVLGELLANGGGVCCLVTRNVVVLQDLWQAGDIHGQGAQGTTGGGESSGESRGQEGDGL